MQKMVKNRKCTEWRKNRRQRKVRNKRMKRAIDENQCGFRDKKEEEYG